VKQRINSEYAAVTTDEEKDDEEESVQNLPTRKMCSCLSAAILKNIWSSEFLSAQRASLPTLLPKGIISWRHSKTSIQQRRTIPFTV